MRARALGRPGHCSCPRAGPGGHSEILAQRRNETSGAGGGHHVSGQDKHNYPGDCTLRVLPGDIGGFYTWRPKGAMEGGCHLGSPKGGAARAGLGRAQQPEPPATTRRSLRGRAAARPPPPCRFAPLVRPPRPRGHARNRLWQVWPRPETPAFCLPPTPKRQRQLADTGPGQPRLPVCEAGGPQDGDHGALSAEPECPRERGRDDRRAPRGAKG